MDKTAAFDMGVLDAMLKIADGLYAKPLFKPKGPRPGSIPKPGFLERARGALSKITSGSQPQATSPIVRRVNVAKARANL